MSKSNSRILIIPDMHMPYCHADTWKFLKAIKRKYKPDRVVCLGDEVDHHALSYHEADPDLDSASPELEKAIRFLKPIYKMFPKVDVLESNHGSLVYRKAKTAGIPRRLIVPYRQQLRAPNGWHWHFELKIKMSNGQVCYFHHSRSGKIGGTSTKEGMCSVEGHHHTKFYALYWRNSSMLCWGAHCGYLGDHNSLSQVYAKNNLEKGIVGAAVILNGQIHLIPMVLKSNGRWNGEVA